MTVPFLNLQAQNAPLRAEIDRAIGEVIDSCAFAGGPHVAAFEKDFAMYCECEHAVGVGNGTDALWFALLARGIGPGDEVITVPSTFMATAEAITYCGATPIFVDIDETTYTMDPALVEAAITPRTRAIIPVHLFGQIADMDPILAIARRHDLFVLEDAAQAHGATYRGRRAGSLGHAGCFSFYPGKNLGAFGEAGAIVTNDAKLAETMRVLRDHGQVRKYHHTMVGWNGRMDGIQGAVLKIKLGVLDRGNERRREHAACYTAGLASIPGFTTPAIADWGTPVFHIYAVRVADRDRIIQELTDRGIGTGIHYPIPVHLQEAYQNLGHDRGAFPVAERCADEFLSLPMFPELTASQIETVIEAVGEIVRPPVPA